MRRAITLPGLLALLLATQAVHCAAVVAERAPFSRPKPPLSGATLARFRSFGFGMVSYYDTYTSTPARDQLINFVRHYNISFVNQYVCASTSAEFFADFVTEMYNQTGTPVNFLFDDTLSANTTGHSTCDIPCTPGASTGQGWCCGSVARKFNWSVQVLERIRSIAPRAVNGAAFDIETLDETDFTDLFQTMREHWNSTILPFGGHQKLRWYFGSRLAPLAVPSLANGLIDEAYWENYQSNTEAYVLRAQRLLSPLAAATKSKHSLVFPGTVSLLSETNCCAQPCASARCSDCGTYSLAYREDISFCSQNKLPRGLGSHSKHMNVEYMLDTLEEGRRQLFNAGYAPLMGPLGMYNYRGLRILLEGTDVLGDPVCPKL